MFGFWSRTASAELLNILAIWLMLWILAGMIQNPLSEGIWYSILLRPCPLSARDRLLLPLRWRRPWRFPRWKRSLISGKGGPHSIRQSLARHFNWILSLKGSLAALCGLAAFALLLFLPVIVTGSRDAVELMWRENVTRFLKPFDHVEPFYSYFKHIPIFLLPWSLVAIASLVSIRKWEAGRPRRWLVCVNDCHFYVLYHFRVAQKLLYTADRACFCPHHGTIAGRFLISDRRE